METWVLSERDVAQVLDAVGRDALMDRVIDRLAEGLAEVGRGERALSPQRGGFERAEPVPGIWEWMPHREAGDSITLKTVGYSPANPDRFGLPTIIGTVARFDDATGALTALTDGVLLTAIRTGAASAVASRLLAAPDSRVAGFIGAGAQSVTQLHALSRVLPLERALVWDTDPAHAASYADRVAFLGLDVRVATPEEIAAEADVICTATSVPIGQGPVLPDVPTRPPPAHQRHRGRLGGQDGAAAGAAAPRLCHPPTTRSRPTTRGSASAWSPTSGVTAWASCARTRPWRTPGAVS
ncbi:hypothetical protein GCM10020000_75370 [Streptomyces olivoverticillatus]